MKTARRPPNRDFKSLHYSPQDRVLIIALLELSQLGLLGVGIGLGLLALALLHITSHALIKRRLLIVVGTLLHANNGILTYDFGKTLRSGIN